MTGFHAQAPAAIAGAIGFGMVFAILISLTESLSKKSTPPEHRASGWLTYGHLVFIPCVFLTGLLADQWSSRGMIVLGSLLAGIGLFGLSFSRQIWMNLLALVGAFLGAASLMSGAIVLFPGAFFHNNAASANLGLVFCSLGGLVAGGLAPLTLQKLDLRRAAGIFAVLCLIPGFVAALFSFEVTPSEPTAFGEAELWSSPVLWLVALGFLLYSPLEGSLSIWTAKYLVQLGFSDRQAGWLMGGFWFSFVASRLAAAYFEYSYVHDSEAMVVIILASLAAVAIGGLAGTRHSRHAILWLLMIGLVLGPIFPNLIGILYRHFGEGELGTAYGTVILVGGGGSLILLPLMSAFADRTSLRVALRLPTVISVILACSGLALALSR